MDLNDLTKTSGEWLRGTGPESDIVMSSRIRLARNLAQFPFLAKADDDIRSEIERTLRRNVTHLENGFKPTYFDVGELDSVDRQFLVERQLISRELSEGHGARGVAVSPKENISVMINEEDHLRLQAFRSGFDLDGSWEDISRLDDNLGERISYAFSDQLGYLTACPTNVGTGIRVSLLVHLPALVITREAQKVFHALQKIHLTVRGLYGEGSQAMGDFYQVSNQVTLGKSEVEIVKTIREVIPNIINYERRIRQKLVEDNRPAIHDRVSRAIGTLRSAQSISTEETMQLLSHVRMGVAMGLIEDLTIPAVNELFLHTQPGHLQKIRRATLDTAERNAARASFLRQKLAV